MPDTLLRPQRCQYCGSLTRRVYTVGPHYACDRDECLRKAIRDAGQRLGVDPAEVEEVLDSTMESIRRAWREDR